MPTDHPAGSRSWLALFVDRPVTVLMLTVTLLVVGCIALSRLPLQLIPEGFEADNIRMFIPTRDLGPAEVEDKVIKPLEEHLRTIPGVRRVRSTARNNMAMVWVELAPGLSPVLGAAEVRDRMQRAKLEWPAGVDRYFTWKESSSDLPLCFLGVLVPEVNDHWNHVVDTIIRPRLEAVDGVGRVELWGLMDEAVKIYFDRERLRGHRINLNEVIRKLGGDNFAQPVGEIEESSSRYLVRVDTKFRSVEEIGAIPVKPGVLVRDLGEVEKVRALRDFVSRIDGKFAFSGAVRKSAGANVVDTSDRLRAECELLKQDPRLAEVDFHFFFMQGDYIRDALDNLLGSGFQGLGWAVGILFLFLWSARLTLVVALSIPLSILATTGYLFFTGDSLNVFSMAGMTLAVGMVVDNAVVVLENIHRHRQLGVPMALACKKGVSEVALAVTLATLTTVVVFLPIIFINDNPRVRLMLGSVGLPLSFALLASLVVALVLLPSGVRALYSDQAAARPPRAPWRGTPVAALAWLNHVVLGFSLRHRVIASVAGVLLLAGAAALCGPPEFGEGRGDNSTGSDLVLSFEFPGATTLVEANRAATILEEFVTSRKDELSVEHLTCRFNRSGGSLELKFVPGVTAGRVRELKKTLAERLPRIPGCKVSLRGGGSQEDEQKEDEHGFTVALTGRDSEQLRGLATQLVRKLEESPSVAEARVLALEGTQEVRVQVDRARAQDLGVDPEVLLGTVTTGLRGAELPRFEEQGREIRLIAQYSTSDDEKLADLKELEVWSNRGGFTPLGDIATFAVTPGLTSIQRIDGKITLQVTGKRREGVGPRAFSAELAGMMRDFPLPRGFHWEEGGRYRETAEDMSLLLRASVLSLVLVFLLMGVLFESTILPGAVLFTIPFAIVGALASLKITGFGLSPMAVVGLILLVGVVVNNGIVLLDAIVRLRAEGRTRNEAIMEAARIRLRPILMTALTTICGLLPMAMSGSQAREGINYRDMSIAVAGGLTVSTFFTTFAVPLAYTFFDDVSVWSRRALASVFGRR